MQQQPGTARPRKIISVVRDSSSAIASSPPFLFFSPLTYHQVKTRVSPRNASPSVNLNFDLGHQATLTHLLPHCTRVQPNPPSESLSSVCLRPSYSQSTPPPSITMSATTNVEKVNDVAVNDIANALSNTSIGQPADDKAAANEAASASAAEGRRLYIGNLAYATTEGELKDFFKSYLVYVQAPASSFPAPQPASSPAHEPSSASLTLPPPRPASRWRCCELLFSPAAAL